MDHRHVDPGTTFQVPGLLPPQLRNPPPQIFGEYMHMPDTLPHDVHFTFDPSGLRDDLNDAKRRRIARACDQCRRKKIKCDGKLPSCSHCINYQTACVFTQVEKKRSPPKGAKYVEGLENRLMRMENILRLSGLLDEDDDDVDLATLEKRLAEKQQQSRGVSHVNSGASSPSQTTGHDDSTTPQSSLTSPEPAKDKDEKGKRSSVSASDKAKEEEELEALSDMMCSLVTNQSGETRYIGSASGFSIFSPKGIEWVNEKTGDASFQHMISKVSIDDHKWNHWKPEVFGDLFNRPVYRPLPPEAEAMSLLKDYFENFNCMFPLFHEPTFMHLVERQYSNNPYEGSGWWASLNVVLATAHRLRVMSKLVSAEEDEKAWGYMKNAIGVFSELAMRSTDLLSVQALLGMALFMQGTPNPQPSFVLIAAAIRLSHSIGLHKKGSGFNLNPIEIEQRKRVFWIAYMLDKDLCLRSGRPPAQDDDDLNVELPEADPPDNIGNIPLADGKGKMNLFRVMVEMTTIEARVYKRLYSNKATKLSEGELLQTIGELDKELEDWKDGIPIDFRPEHEIKASHTPLMLHVVMVHFSYYNCLTTIHRMSIHRGYWTNRLSDYAIKGLNAKPLNPRVFASAALCASAARATISLLKYVPQGDFSCVWMILYFPVTALVTIFGNILQNPLDPRAKSDTKLMNLVVTFLSTLGQEAEVGGVHRMLGVCAAFERIANVVIERMEKDSSRRKRKNHDLPRMMAEARPPAQMPKHTPSHASIPHAAPAPAPAPTQQLFNDNNNNNGMPGAQGHAPTLRSSPNLSLNRNPFNSAADTATRSANSQAPSLLDGSGRWPQQQQEHPAVNAGNGSVMYTTPDFSNFADLTGFGQAHVASPPLQQQQQIHSNNYSNINGGSSFQPLLPQDLWQMPMSLDWDWAELSGGPYPGLENGALHRATNVKGQ